MKTVINLSVISGFMFLSACVPLKPNPDFDKCINVCSTQQDTCMVNASTAKAIERCNANQNKCVETCGARYPRYLK